MYMHICSNKSHDINPTVEFPLNGLSTYILSISHGTTSDKTARIPSMYHNGASDQLEPSEVIRDNVLI
jgi:hypothetical protein